MGHLFVLTRPDQVTGFRLAGVDAYAAEDVETAQELVESWMAAEEGGLLAIDDGLLERWPLPLSSAWGPPKGCRSW